MQTIQVGQQQILVDTEDFAGLSALNWRINDKGYAVCSAGGKSVKMHQMLCPASEGMVTDHINRNRLDNRKCNLRVTSHRVNALNRSPSRKVKGVYVNAGKFEAKIKVLGRLIYIGRFDTEDEAAKAYQDIASLVNEE